MSAVRVPTREAFSINLQRQISLFLENYSIVIPKDNDQVYFWQYKGAEHKLTKEEFDRLVAAIVDEWIDGGWKDISEFREQLGLSLEKVVSIVEDLVFDYLGEHFGLTKEVE